MAAANEPNSRPHPPRWWDVAFGVVVGVLVSLILVEALWLTVRMPRGTPIRLLTPTPRQLVVHVTGAVHAPGVYTLPEGSRVQDALRAAGGPARDADLEHINLARPLQDGEQIRVPRKMPTAVPTAQDARSTPPSPVPLRLDINTATAQELEALPGIGPTLAQRIVEYREAHGPFTSVEGLLQVKGIGPVLLEKIRPYIYVAP